MWGVPSKTRGADGKVGKVGSLGRRAPDWLVHVPPRARARCAGKSPDR